MREGRGGGGGEGRGKEGGGGGGGVKIKRGVMLCHHGQGELFCASGDILLETVVIV